MKQGYEFTDCTQFLGAKMFDTHIAEETKEGLKITSILKVQGFLSFLWVKLVASNVAKTVPNDIDTIVDIARR